MGICAAALTGRGLQHQLRKGVRTIDPTADTIKVLTMHASKGLQFSGGALVAAGHMPASSEEELEGTKLSYVGAKRATQRLIIGFCGDELFGERLGVQLIDVA